MGKEEEVSLPSDITRASDNLIIIQKSTAGEVTSVSG